MRHFHFCDSLEPLQDRIRYDSVHLIYYTPPFYSKRDYNFPFRKAKGHVQLSPGDFSSGRRDGRLGLYAAFNG